jgi:hypothetical protein
MTVRIFVRAVTAIAAVALLSEPLFAGGGAVPFGPEQSSQPPPATPPPAQPPAGATTQKPADQKPSAPVSDEELDRIRKALEKPLDLQPKVNLNDDRLKFYLSIVAKQPSMKEILGSYDLMNGPTRRGNPMTHQEFLAMVTPKDLYGQAGIKPTEALQFAIFNVVAQAIIKKGLQEMSEAKTERELREIRDRIDRELAALARGAGGK